MNALLEAKSVCVWRGDNLLLDNIAFTVSSGEVLRVAGTNGSGKTTLLRSVCGLAYLDEGSIHWRGVSTLKNRDQFYTELLYIGHKPGIKGALTPVENLRLFAALGNQSSGHALDDAIHTALDALALTPTADIACRHLSAGQQRRVSLARLMLQDATLWVLDEPLTSLDTHGLEWVQTRIADHVHQGGLVLLTTHADLTISGTQVRSIELG